MKKILFKDLKDLLSFLFICFSLTAMAGTPQFNKAEFAKSTKGQMVMKVNTLSQNLTAPVMKKMTGAKAPASMKFINSIRPSIANNMLRKRAPRRLSAEDLINQDKYLDFKYVWDLNTGMEWSYYHFRGGEGVHFQERDGVLCCVGLFWDDDPLSPAFGSSWWLDLNIDFTTGEVQLPTGNTLVDSTVVGSYANGYRIDKEIYRMLVDGNYFFGDAEAPGSVPGTLYEDGSIEFNDSIPYVYAGYNIQHYYTRTGNAWTGYTYKLDHSDTTFVQDIYLGTQFLVANGTQDYDYLNQGAIAGHTTDIIYMMQPDNNTLYVFNMCGDGMPNAEIRLTPEGVATYPTNWPLAEAGNYLRNTYAQNYQGYDFSLMHYGWPYAMDESYNVIEDTLIVGTVTPELLTLPGIHSELGPIYASSDTQHTTGYALVSNLINHEFRFMNGDKFILNDSTNNDSTEIIFLVDGIYYKIISDNIVAVVRGKEAYQGFVHVPEGVTYEGVTYEVAGIVSGAFADATLQSLILPVSLVNVEDGAFDGCHINSLIITGNGSWKAGAIAGEIDNLYVMSTVTGIGSLQVNPTTIYSYSTVPPTCNDNTFTGYDGALHVPASSLAAYFTAPYWSNFINIVGDAVEPTGIKLNNDSIEVLVGNQLSLNATITPSNAVPRDVIWTTSNKDIATVTDGAITAIKAGECDIKAYLLDKTAICHVTVTEITPTEVTLSQEFAKLEIGSQLTLTATVLPDNATDKQVTWSTTNSAVATVDSLGHVTAVGEGECFITATCRDKQAMCHVIVIDHFIYITLDEHDVRLMPNHMMTLTPTVSPANTTLVVTSSDPTVAAARMANGNIQLVGIKEGTTVITVNSTDGYAEADSCLVKVYTLRGDVNSDGFINISDVTVLINYLLSGSAEGINIINADANNDGKITISDVSVLISSLLSGEPLAPKEEPIG